MFLNRQQKKSTVRYRLWRSFWIFVSVISLLGVTAGSLPISAQAETKKPKIGKATSASRYITAEDWPEEPKVDAYSAVLMEVETGTVLYAKNPDTQMYPASITKIMTALLTLENCKLTDQMTFSEEAIKALPPNYVSMGAAVGEQMKVEDCVNALLIYSANDAANCLAVHQAGSIPAFVKLMNQRAKEAGAKKTHFNNPSGLHEENHYTTAYDMCRILRACAKLDTFNEIAGRRTYTIPRTNKNPERVYYAKHKMLFPTHSAYYPYVVSGKTGYTDEAGNTLVTYAEKDGLKLVCCVMKCGQGITYKDTKTLFEYGFNNFHMADASGIDNRFTLTDVGIFGTEDVDSFSNFRIALKNQSPVVLPTGAGFSKIETKLEYLPEIEDNCFAEVEFQYEGMTVGTARLQFLGNSAGSGETFNFDTDEGAEVAEGSGEEETAGNGYAESSGEPTAAGENADALNGGNKLFFEDIWSQTKTVDIRVAAAIAVVAAVIIAVIVTAIIKKKDDRIRYDTKRRRRRRRRRR